MVASDRGHKTYFTYMLILPQLPGLTEALGTEGVGCNYSVHTVKDTFKALQKFNGGEAIFTLPATPVKCLGAPQKIMYLADEIFRKVWRHMSTVVPPVL